MQAGNPLRNNGKEYGSAGHRALSGDSESGAAGTPTQERRIVSPACLLYTVVATPGQYPRVGDTVPAIRSGLESICVGSGCSSRANDQRPEKRADPAEVVVSDLADLERGRLDGRNGVTVALTTARVPTPGRVEPVLPSCGPR
jgi:hypothetical protein